LAKNFPEKWFLLGLFSLALVGSLLGSYFFENDFLDRLVQEKKLPEAVNSPPQEKETAFLSAISEEKLNALVDKLTLEEKVGQMLLVGFFGQEVTLETQKLLQENYLGGIILNENNMVSLFQLKKLTDKLQRLGTYKEIPLFIALSQEGGVVNPLTQGLTVFPGNMAVGATKSSEYAYRFGRVTGQELKGLGINLNLAPVLDLATEARNPVVGTRAFSEDPQVAAILGERYLAGLQNTGVAAGAKHFPGQGDISSNPYAGLPILPFSREDLEMRELIPFKEAIRHDLTAIVMGHLLFPEIDSRYPTNFSAKFMRDLLRDKEKGLGFEGLIISGDLAVKSIIDNPGIVPGAIQAVKAGADLLIISHDDKNQLKAYQALLGAVKRNEIPESQINASVKRILRTKFRYAIVYPKKEAELFHRIATRAHRKWANRIAEHSLTVVKNEQKVLPLGEKEKILLLAPSELPSGGDAEYLAQLLLKYYPSL